MNKFFKKIAGKVSRFTDGNSAKKVVDLEKLVSHSHDHKQKIIKKYQLETNIHILIETGTYLGDMVEAQMENFRNIYSIELGVELYKNAVQRFKDNPTVKILQGDSGIVLKNVLTEINEPCIFWLDGHYSEGITAKGKKECPILEELTSIFLSQRFCHVILIDDARLFLGKNDYPTIEELKNFINGFIDDYKFFVEDDIIKIILK